jgi:uncharacterized protein (TIGR03000 family)
MQQRGQDRVFVSPRLQDGTEYAYEITAKWTAAGKEHRETQKVAIRKGDQKSVVFK